MRLSNEESGWYETHKLLTGWGEAGQAKLKAASVLCVGAGGLGCPVLNYLAAAGVGTIGIVDDDKVSLANLSRQVLYGAEDVGKKKGAVAKQRLQMMNPHIMVQWHDMRLMLDNALEIVDDYDVVVDASDNFMTHYLVNDVCFRLQKPDVTAAVECFKGFCTVFVGGVDTSPCYRCLFPDVSVLSGVKNCQMAGVLGTLPGLFGLLQATEVIKYVLGLGQSLVGRLLQWDALEMQWRQWILEPNPDCVLCGCDDQKLSLSSLPYPSEDSLNYVDNGDRFDMSELFTSNVPSGTTLTPQALHAMQLETNTDEPKKAVRLIDVRQPEEHASYNIGGQLIPLDTLADYMEALYSAHKDEIVVVYCHAGIRSAKAAQLLRERGFEHVLSLEGGLLAWQAYIKQGKAGVE